ncbi:uncharacterized protein METZ01_LOCUS384665 [marine metagenome]|uniref:Uncharacterized protein n=1 Tax=marine metagenome TaxID=408172 RepID=A0A382UDH7_9ZZZZ
MATQTLIVKYVLMVFVENLGDV